MQAPSVGGVRLPKGKGETVRLPRGASLTDFAEKIDANPASLVQVLFHLGEMVTATQSVSDDILELLGGVHFPRVGELPYLLTLGGYGFYWIRLPAPTTPREG